MSKNKWVDFKKVKESVSMSDLLEHYGLSDRFKQKGDHLTGTCPFHGSGANPNQFSVSLSKNIFQCFSGDCEAKGNVLDFVSRMEEISIRDAALRIAEVFSVESKKAPRPRRKKASEEPKPEDPPANEPDLKENAILTFTLKNIDHAHEYLEARGISEKTATAFGAGYYAGKGMMKGRLVIPIHNASGQCVAYAGRLVAQEILEGEEKPPKYLLPSGFKKSLELFNIHEALKQDRAVLVEGFFDVMKLHELGIENAVGLMGSSMSPEQEALILDHFSYITVMMDGDDAGRRAQEEIAGRLCRKIFVKIHELPEGMEPDKLTEKPF